MFEYNPIFFAQGWMNKFALIDNEFFFESR